MKYKLFFIILIFNLICFSIFATGQVEISISECEYIGIITDIFNISENGILLEINNEIKICIFHIYYIKIIRIGHKLYYSKEYNQFLVYEEENDK